MKQLCKRALALLLTVSLLMGTTAIPSTAGSLAAYAPGGPRFVNSDGWALLSFEANGPNRHAALGWADSPTSIHLETFWEKNGEVVEHSVADQRVTVPPGTFTWKIEDESVARLLPAQQLPDGDPDIAANAYIDGTNVLLFCLREGKTVLTVTGPHGKVSKCGLVVLPEEAGNYDHGDNGYRNDEIFATPDGWTIQYFQVRLNEADFAQELGVGDTGTVQLHSAWYRLTSDVIPDLLSGYLDLAAAEFTWRVSDERIAVLRDDYPGSNARSIVALREGIVDVTVTGPLGKAYTLRIYVLPMDEFSDDTGDPEPPKPPNPGPDPTPDPDPEGFDFWDWLNRPPKTALVTGITIRPTSMELYPGEYELASATVLPWNAANRNVTWSSSDESVFTVNAYGLVQAVAPGSARLTATAQDGSGKSASALVRVKPFLVERITLRDSEVEIFVGEQFQLSAEVKPDRAMDKRVRWASSDTSVATVDQNGLVTTKKVGQVTITCTAQDGSGVKATCRVTIKPRLVESITLNAENIEIYEKDTYQLTAKVLPENATYKGVTWSSADTRIASVSKTGLVTGRKAGAITVTCTALDGGGVKAVCRVTVNVKPRPEELNYDPVPQAVNGITLNLAHMNVYAGSTRLGNVDGLKATVDATSNDEKGVIWSSSNNNIATVESKLRVGNVTPCDVTGVNVGCTYVTAAAFSAPKESVRCHVHVVTKVTKTNYICTSNPSGTYYQCPGNKGTSWTVPYEKKVSVIGEYGNSWLIEYDGKSGFILKTQLMKKSEWDKLTGSLTYPKWNIPLSSMISFLVAVTILFFGMGGDNDAADAIVKALEAPLRLFQEAGKSIVAIFKTLYEALEGLGKPKVNYDDFAAAGYLCPVRYKYKSINDGRQFGSIDAVRGGRAHAAIDILVQDNGIGDVYASTDGTVVQYVAAYYEGTSAIRVRNDDGTFITYAEISTSKRKGDQVERGKVIGETKKHNGKNYSMLHLEFYLGIDKNGTIYTTAPLADSSNKTFDYVTKRNYERRRDLLDPTFFTSLPIQ